MKAQFEDLLSGLVALSAGGREVSVTIVDVAEEGPFYDLKVVVEGNPQPMDVYITKDGEYIILGPVAKVEELKKDIETQLKALKEGTPINYNIEAKGTPKGNAESPIKIVEFSDFQCPFCYRFWQTTLPQLMESYGDKVAFYYRHFPLSFHPAAEPAAIASYCADQQGAFWAYHDKLFENHDRLAQEGTSEEFYVSLAEELGLDVDAFRECMNSTEAKDYVKEDYNAGLTYGVQGTPTFFIVVDKSIPKDKVVEAFSYIPSQAGAKLYIAPDAYVIAFSGALPYEVWDKVLSTLEGSEGG